MSLENLQRRMVQFNANQNAIANLILQKKAKNALVVFEKAGSDSLDAEPITDGLFELVNEDENKGIQESFALNITLNEKQLVARDFAFQGKSFCLIGPAGSGKTTAQRAVAKSLYESGKLLTTTFKDIGGSYFEAPSIAFVAFTRRAAGNLRKAIHKDPLLENVFNGNIMTIHQLLEYSPEYYFCPIELKQKFRFAPRRTALNPLSITHLVIEEASMVDAAELWQKLYDALPEGIQIIFIGDINQLQPVFGPSVLNYALTQLPIVELTETYRNQGIVLENAHNILKGNDLVTDNNFQLVAGKSDVQPTASTMRKAVINMLNIMRKTEGDDGLMEYDPEHDMILSPFNVGEMGTNNLNSWIAQHIGQENDVIVHEIIAGFKKLYLAVGDKVMVNKRDGVIKEIRRNPRYFGKEPQLPGSDLSRFGHRVVGAGHAAEADFDAIGESLNYENFSLEALENEQAERKQQASHIVVVDHGDGMTVEVSGAGEFSDQTFSLGYALTCHKAQGSEFRKVIIVMHKEHATMLSREWFYTAVTRARTKVVVIAKQYIVDKAIKTQRMKGDTLKDKLDYFNSGINNTLNVECVK